MVRFIARLCTTLGGALVIVGSALVMLGELLRPQGREPVDLTQYAGGIEQ